MADLKLLWVPEIQCLEGWCQRCSKEVCVDIVLLLTVSEA